jgi:hypothetical protein
MNTIAKQQFTESLLRGIATAIEQTLYEKLGKMGFALVIFEFYEPGIGHYVSNAKREDIVKALRELAGRLEKKQDIPPGNKTVQ